MDLKQASGTFISHHCCGNTPVAIFYPTDVTVCWKVLGSVDKVILTESCSRSSGRGRLYQCYNIILGNFTIESEVCYI